jgi:hypothetical protein
MRFEQKLEQTLNQFGAAIQAQELTDKEQTHWTIPWQH